MRSVTRFALGLSLIALGSLTVTQTAWAKKDAGTTEKKWTPIVVTNISDFDSVFSKVKTIDDTIDAQTTTLNTAHTNVNTVLGVAEGSALSDGIKAAIAAAGGKLSLDTSSATPHLKAASGADDTVKKDADAVNGLADAGAATVKTVTDLVPQAEALVEACKDFPAKIKTIVTDPAELLKATPLLMKDMKATSETPARIKALSDAAVQVFTDIKAAFSA